MKYWTNKINKQYHNEGVNHEWASFMITMADELEAYCQQYHLTGLAWNANGPEASLSELEKES